MHDAAADILHDGPLDFVLAADFLYPVGARLPPSIVLHHWLRAVSLAVSLGRRSRKHTYTRAFTRVAHLQD
jgi:hypothetical protein